MPGDPQSDQDFLKASPEDQHAYLMATDPDYAKAKPDEQVAYRQHIASAPNAGLAPAAGPAPIPDPQPSAVSRFGNSAMRAFGIGTEEEGKNFFRHPIDTLTGMANSQGELGKRAYHELGKGDVTRGLAHGAEYLLPVIGPQLAKSGDQLESGDIAGGLGTMAGVGAGVAAGKAFGEMVPKGVAKPGVGGSMGQLGAPKAASPVSATNAPITEALHVPTKSPKMQSAITDVEGARPYMKGVKSQAEAQARIPNAKSEIWEPYNKAVETVKDNVVTGPDGPISVGELEAERLKTAADLQTLRKTKPTDQQTALQQEKTLAQLVERDKAIKAALDPELRTTGIDPEAIRRVHGNVKGVERQVSGKSTVTEPMRPYGVGKMIPRTLPNKLGIRELNWQPIEGVKDIAAGRPLWKGRPTDVAMKELFKSGGPKPNFGTPIEPGSAGRGALLKQRLRDLSQE